MIEKSNDNDMDLELLRTFLELDRTRHFGRTAEVLHLTQAAVSSRLKKLESHLGVRLFERSNRQMRLTTQGRRLIRHAEQQIALWRVARQDVSLSETSEQLVIGGSLRLWDVLLQRWLQDLRRNNPDLALTAESQSPDILVRRLIDGSLDVAVMLEPPQLGTLHVREIAKLEIICVSSFHGLDVDQALNADYVYVDWGLSFGLDHRRTFPNAREAKTRVSRAKMALEYLAAVGGTAYLPRQMIQGDLDSGKLHKVENAPAFLRQAFAAYPVRSPRLDLITQSLEIVRTY